MENNPLRANTPSGVQRINHSERRVDPAFDKSVDDAFAEYEGPVAASEENLEFDPIAAEAGLEFDPIAAREENKRAEGLARTGLLTNLPKMKEPEAGSGEEIDPNLAKDLRVKGVMDDLRGEKFVREYQAAKKAGNVESFRAIDPSKTIDPAKTMPHFPGSRAYAAEQVALAEERAKTIQEAIKRYPSAQAEYNKKRAEGPKLPHFPGSKPYLEEQARLNPVAPEAEELDDAYLAENMVEILPGEENEKVIYPSDLEADDIKKAA